MSVSSPLNLNCSGECHFKTSLVKHTFDFRWKIENYPNSSYHFKVKSPEFYPAKKLTFYATLDLYGQDEKISFFLQSKDDIIIDHAFSIEDSTGKQLYRNEEYDRLHAYIYGSEPFVIKKTRTLWTLLALSHSTKVLIYKCKMEFLFPSTDVEPTNLQPSAMGKSPSLVGDLKAMYDNSLYADLRIQVDDSTVLAHKSLLSARSPVFAQMFESPMKENGAIEIVDLKLHVLKGLLEFLYTEILSEDDFEYVCDLYCAANIYCVHTLKEKCKDVLLSKMDVRNACRVLSLANRHSDVQFKDSIMDFIQDRFDDIQESDSWEEFLNGETTLAAEVMQSRRRKRKREQN